jgi:hypothetical protein
MKLIVTSALFLAAAYCSANAFEVLPYKTGATNLEYKQETVEAVWSSKNSPACIKDGSKLIGVNAAFKTAGLGYRDCSTSDAAKRKQRKAGYTVTVFKVDLLPQALFDQVMKK